MENGDGRGDGNGGDPRERRPRRATIYSLVVGMAFVGVIFVAGVNTISNGRRGPRRRRTRATCRWPSSRCRTPARASTGDANIAQDDCDSARIPCPVRQPSHAGVRGERPGGDPGLRLFNRPLVLSFWFTRGGDCENQEDVFERAYRRFSDRVNFLAVDVRDSDREVRKLIAEHHWTHPIGLDRDGGALQPLPDRGAARPSSTPIPGGILQSTSIGELDDAAFDARVNRLLAATKQRDETLR